MRKPVSPAAPLSDAVATQYEQWVYPEPITDLAEWVAAGHSDAVDPQRMHLAYWPDGSFREDLRILVAGCGSNQAATLAFTNPQAQVVGIDISSASLEHEATLKKKHGLVNLTLQRRAIEEFADNSKPFDLVVSTGVLHHLENPAQGLNALKRVVHTDGVLSLMLYAKFPRTGIQMAQHFFDLLGLKQGADDVSMVRETLETMRPDHLANQYVTAARDLDSDTGIVARRIRPNTGPCVKLVG